MRYRVSYGAEDIDRIDDVAWQKPRMAVHVDGYDGQGKHRECCKCRRRVHPPIWGRYHHLDNRENKCGLFSQIFTSKERPVQRLSCRYSFILLRFRKHVGSTTIDDPHRNPNWQMTDLASWRNQLCRVMTRCIWAVGEPRQIRDDNDKDKDWNGDDVKLDYKIQVWSSIIQGVFFHWYPPKKYGKPRLGESTLT